MSTLFGEGSLGKKIITWVSAIIIVLPIVAYSTVESVEAAAYNNATDTVKADPSIPLKTATRDPNKIVSLSVTHKQGVPILRMNISASSNDVIKKGDQLDIKFNSKNVDTKQIKELAAQDDNSLYSISKKGSDLVVNFKKDASTGNYQEVFGIATKNIKADTKASATFAGKNIKIDNNNINSTYKAPQKQAPSNQTQKTANSNSGSNQASTQSASENGQAESSNGQATQTQANQSTQNN